MHPAPEKLESLQVLRAVAVLAVVLSHSLHELAALLAGIVRDFDEKILPGDFGVDLFFVASGFIMVHVSRHAFGQPGAGLQFVRRRLIRIVPLYWIMTTLMIAVVVAIPGAVDTATADLRQWLSSYFFIPFARESDGLMRPVLGLGWSLNYEMFFYALFALCLWLPRNRAVAAVLLLLSATWLAGCFTPLGQVPAFAFLSHPVIFEFAAGVMLGWVRESGVRLDPAAALGSIAAGILLLFAAPGFDQSLEEMRHVVYGAPAVLIVAGAILSRGVEGFRGNRLLVSTGDASYSIYLTHPFVLGALALVAKQLDLTSAMDPDLFMALFLVAAFAFSLLAGHATHRLLDEKLTAAIARRTSKLPPVTQVAASR